MTEHLDKRVAVLELFKAGKSTSNTSNDLKVNRMLTDNCKQNVDS